MKALLVLISLAGCTTDLADRITIDQGAYGELSIAADTAGADDAVDANTPVAAYIATAPYAMAASTSSDDSGVYELALDPGTYIVCASGAAPTTLASQYLMNCAGNCTRLDVPTGRVRADWAFNLSGGWWNAGDNCARN